MLSETKKERASLRQTPIAELEPFKDRSEFSFMRQSETRSKKPKDLENLDLQTLLLPNPNLNLKTNPNLLGHLLPLSLLSVD
jgi:hypothetical protein